LVYQCICFNLLYMKVIKFPIFEIKFNIAKLYVSDSAPDLELMTAKYYSQTVNKWNSVLC
jgi:hypothetical protein